MQKIARYLVYVPVDIINRFEAKLDEVDDEIYRVNRGTIRMAADGKMVRPYAITANEGFIDPTYEC